MLRGLYTAAAGMISEQRKHDTITNNIANLNTPGFKAGNAISRSFPDMLISAMEGGSGGASKVLGRLNTGVLAEEDVSLYLQGDLQETQSPFDLALVSDIVTDPQGNALPPFNGTGKYVGADGQRIFQPQAFFTVQKSVGEVRFSRNGKFSVNDTGELITSEGYQVLGSDNKPIVLRDPATGNYIPEAKITSEGSLLDSRNGRPLVDVNGRPLKLLISRVENPNRMIREGNGVYRLNEEDGANVSTVVPNGEVQVRQGFVERSNVDPTQSMVDMMSALRAYEANQKVIQFYDKSLEKAVNEVGRV